MDDELHRYEKPEAEKVESIDIRHRPTGRALLLPLIAAFALSSAALRAQDADHAPDQSDTEVQGQAQDRSQVPAKRELSRGHFGFGFQRATWYSWGGSAMVDLFTPYLSFEAIGGFFPEYAAYGRGIGRFLMLRGFNAYLAGGGGVANVPVTAYGGHYHALNLYWSAYLGVELDMRLLIPEGPAWFIDAEGGVEQRTKSLEGGWWEPFPSFGLGTHIRF